MPPTSEARSVAASPRAEPPASSAAAPGDDRGGGARAADRRRRPAVRSGAAARLGRAEADARREQRPADPAVEREAPGGEQRRLVVVLGGSARGARRSRPGQSAGLEQQRARSTSGASQRPGHRSARRARSRPGAICSPVQQSAAPRAGSSHARPRRVGPAGDDGGAAGDAAGPVVEERRGRRDARRARRRGLRGACPLRRSRSPQAGRGGRAARVRPARTDDAPRRVVAGARRAAPTAQRGGSAGQGHRLPAERGASRPVVPGRRDHERVEPQRARDRARASGPSAERGEGLRPSGTSAIRAASCASPSPFGSTARSSPASSWSVRA